MPAYNFHKQFVPMILDGSKPHTIRRRRKRRPTVVGDAIMMFTGMRTAQCDKFATSNCVKVDPITIYVKDRKIGFGDNHFADENEIAQISKDDGFPNMYEFFHFFKRYKQDVLEDFEIIWWDPAAFRPGVCSLGFDMTKD